MNDMKQSVRTLTIGVVAALGVQLACDAQTARRTDSMPSDVSNEVQSMPAKDGLPPASSATSAVERIPQPDAGAVLDSFLTSQIETGPHNPARYAALQMCPPDEEAEVAFWLADFEVLTSSRIDDSVVVSAAIQSVAEQRDTGDAVHASVVTSRVQTDTLHWTLRRDRRTDTWRVCGRSHEDVDLGGYGRVDNVTYAPSGETRIKLIAKVDSIRRVRSQERR